MALVQLPLSEADFYYAYGVAKEDAITTGFCSLNASAAAGLEALRLLRRVERLPRGARALQDRIRVCLGRAYARCQQRYTLPEVPRLARGWPRVVRAIEDSFDRCAYRAPAGKWAGGDVQLNVLIADMRDTVRCLAETRRAWSDNGKWSGNDLEVDVYVLPSWYRRVYMTGRAVIDNHLILDIADDGRQVLAVKQGRGLQLGCVRARINKAGRLTWKG